MKGEAPTSKPSLAARIDEEKSHPLAWKTVASRAAKSHHGFRVDSRGQDASTSVIAGNTR